jgi:membrane-associated HD superfamily phosphohydrolase
MSTKARVQFRPVPYVQEIHQVQDRDPEFTYKNVIMTYHTDPGRIQRYLQRGWEIVETTEASRDDRAFTPTDKKEKLRPQMRVETTKCGHEQILMRILTSKWEENKLADKKQSEQLKLQEALRRGDRVSRRGNEIVTEGAELNENSFK